MVLQGRLDRQHCREDWCLEINFTEKEQHDLTEGVRIRKSPKGKMCGFIHSANIVMDEEG